MSCTGRSSQKRCPRQKCFGGKPVTYWRQAGRGTRPSATNRLGGMPKARASVTMRTGERPSRPRRATACMSMMAAKARTAGSTSLPSSPKPVAPSEQDSDSDPGAGSASLPAGGSHSLEAEVAGGVAPDGAAAATNKAVGAGVEEAGIDVLMRLTRSTPSPATARASRNSASVDIVIASPSSSVHVTEAPADAGTPCTEQRISLNCAIVALGSTVNRRRSARNVLFTATGELLEDFTSAISFDQSMQLKSS